MIDNPWIDGGMNRFIRQIQPHEQKKIFGNTDLRSRNADAVFYFKRFLHPGNQQMKSGIAGKVFKIVTGLPK
jgi:hypothetical protein